jgi:hypothetical protein
MAIIAIDCGKPKTRHGLSNEALLLELTCIGHNEGFDVYIDRPCVEMCKSYFVLVLKCGKLTVLLV